MTTLLQQAFSEAAKLSEPEQEVLASRLLAELATEDDFDRAIAHSSEKLAALGRETLMNEQWRSRITMEPGKRGGRPCIRGMRITVYDVLSYLAAGMTVAEVLDDFPYLTPEDIQACFGFAAERERTMLVAVA